MDDSPQGHPLDRRSKPSQKLKAGNAIQMTDFTRLVEHTVDALRGGGNDQSFEDVKRILIDIRKQYDEVHCDAERREKELTAVRREIRLAEPVEKNNTYNGMSRADVLAQIDEVKREIKKAAEQQMVYKHLVSRLKREELIVQQKVRLMEQHYQRKSHEVKKRQECSRRMHEGKIACSNQLEGIEEEIDLERNACNAALEDLELVAQQRYNDVKHRDEFERWRYEVALETASEAFQATAGRYRKVYAIEKLTGCCLQKITYEQAEQSQATEDGFQKIREVTGLTDVMDIVHKFLNRDVEHEQLRAAVKEAEVRLYALREAESVRHGEGALMDLDIPPPRPRGLNQEVAECELSLARAQRDHETYQRNLLQGKLRMDAIIRWARRVSLSLGPFEELMPINSMEDVLPFFQQLAQTVDRFFSCVQSEVPIAKLAKLATQASTRQTTEQDKLLTDKEFLQKNCRVAAGTAQDYVRSFHKANTMTEDERQDQEVTMERKRLKEESHHQVGDKEREIRAPVAPEKTRPNSRHEKRKTVSGGPQEDGHGHHAEGDTNAHGHGHAHGQGHGGAPSRPSTANQAAHGSRGQSPQPNSARPHSGRPVTARNRMGAPRS